MATVHIQGGFGGRAHARNNDVALITMQRGLNTKNRLVKAGEYKFKACFLGSDKKTDLSGQYSFSPEVTAKINAFIFVGKGAEKKVDYLLEVITQIISENSGLKDFVAKKHDQSIPNHTTYEARLQIRGISYEDYSLRLIINENSTSIEARLMTKGETSLTIRNGTQLEAALMDLISHYFANKGKLDNLATETIREIAESHSSIHF